MTRDKFSPVDRRTFRQAVEVSRAKRASVRAMVARGQSTRADDDERRLNAVLMRKQARGGKEALQGLSNDLQPISFMTEGASVQRTVAKIVVDTDEYHEEGSGFLVGHGVLITNQHVIHDTAAAHAAVVIFDYELDELGQHRAETRYRLDPDRLELFSPEDGGLDYALIALGERIEGDAPLTDLGYCALSNSKDRHFIGMNVNVIQHPGGERKQVAIRNNLLTHRTDSTLLYETDTDVGSSGSPVFNDDWEVIALHHYGEPFTEISDSNGDPLPLNVNEGIRISSIYDDLTINQLPNLSGPKRDLLLHVLSPSPDQLPRTKLPQLERRPQTSQRESAIPGEEKRMPLEKDDAELKLSIPMTSLPIEVNIRMGGSYGAGSRAEQPLQLTGAMPQLSRSAEGKRLDRDYSNRNGFDVDFIDNVPVNLARLVSPLASRVAPLIDGTENGELKYQNFSVIMDKLRDFALLTATNIDGDSYMNVDRKSGQANDAEGETWYKDRRISDQHYVGQSFYSAWSHKFDRGHLTRRNDPTWGPTHVEAERANADTFHFTNCTPQHFRFNQSADFWQGIERYVLEQGVLQPGRAKRLTVLQGPVLDDRDDPWAGDVQVPAQFWKIVLWNGANGPRAVGMLANQSDLFDEDRVSLRRPSGDQPVEVRQFHVPISIIAKLTKLDLNDFLPIDTFKNGLPSAGEAVARITKWANVKL